MNPAIARAVAAMQEPELVSAVWQHILSVRLTWITGVLLVSLVIATAMKRAYDRGLMGRLACLSMALGFALAAMIIHVTLLVIAVQDPSTAVMSHVYNHELHGEPVP